MLNVINNVLLAIVNFVRNALMGVFALRYVIVISAVVVYLMSLDPVATILTGVVAAILFVLAELGKTVTVIKAPAPVTKAKTTKKKK